MPDAPRITYHASRPKYDLILFLNVGFNLLSKKGEFVEVIQGGGGEAGSPTLFAAGLGGDKL